MVDKEVSENVDNGYVLKRDPPQKISALFPYFLTTPSPMFAFFYFYPSANFKEFWPLPPSKLPTSLMHGPYVMVFNNFITKIMIEILKDIS